MRKIIPANLNENFKIAGIKFGCSGTARAELLPKFPPAAGVVDDAPTPLRLDEGASAGFVNS
jgi:hypothetical protein